MYRALTSLGGKLESVHGKRALITLYALFPLDSAIAGSHTPFG